MPGVEAFCKVAGSGNCAVDPVVEEKAPRASLQSGASDPCDVLAFLRTRQKFVIARLSAREGDVLDSNTQFCGDAHMNLLAVSTMLVS